MTEAEANRGIVLLTEAEAEAEEKSPFLGKTEAEAEDSVDPCDSKLLDSKLPCSKAFLFYNFNKYVHSSHETQRPKDLNTFQQAVVLLPQLFNYSL